MMPSELVAAIDARPPTTEAKRLTLAVQVEIDKGNLTLPPLPETSDVAGQCAFLTAAFNLDPRHPVTGGEWHGLRGPDGHVSLLRLGAPALSFEPSRSINTPMRLIEALQWQRAHQDGAPHAYKGNHCRLIAHVVACLTDASAAVTAEQEAEGIVGAFLSTAQPIEGMTTYGNGPQRYEAAAALQREVDGMSNQPIGPPKYLVDRNTGEIVIRLSDLTFAARSYIGGSLARGWLDARMSNIHWQRIRLDGHAQPGREGRHGSHLRVDVYRGLLTVAQDAAVTT